MFTLDINTQIGRHKKIDEDPNPNTNPTLT